MVEPDVRARPEVPARSSSWRGGPSWVGDALLGAGVAAALALIIATDAGGVRQAPVLAYVFAVGLGAVMLLRRSMPRAVLGLSVLAMFAYYTVDLPPIGVAVPVLAAVFSAAEAGLMAWATGAGLVVFAVSLYFRIRDGGEALGFVLGYESVSNIALLAAAIALGYGIRARRARAAQQEKIDALTRAQHAREAQLQVRGERERLSRDLHDTLGHTLSVISLHAGVGAEALGRDERAAGEAFEQIRGASSRSLKDLRSMVHVLRSSDEHPETHRVPSLTAASELLETACDAGLGVTSAITVAPGQLSGPVDAAAYRVLQESITNVIRHAGATAVDVRAAVNDGHLRVCVSDDGRGPTAGQAKEGHGMTGMAERVRLLGGTLSTRCPASGGFTVEAVLPLEAP